MSLGRMSISQFKKWRDCEARTYAEYILETYDPKSTAAQLESQFGHVLVLEPLLASDWIDANIDKVKAKTKGTELKVRPDIKAKKPYVDVEAAAIACLAEPAFQRFFGKDNGTPWIEHDLEWEIGGKPWRGRLDMVAQDGSWLMDAKFMASLIERPWMQVGEYENGDPINRRVDWWEAWGYWQQLAVYWEGVRQNFNVENPVIWVVGMSKESPPDRELYLFDDMARIKLELETIEADQKSVTEARYGEREAWRCEKCDWCRKGKTITAPMVVSSV